MYPALLCLYDSDYAINGVPCRLLDIQDLLSDAGVGRNQHVIVGQGQIDAILNARPEERRAIIEEAAGVLKHRKRKERSERRLIGTEGNLQRVTDLLRELRRQLRPLERQAEAARRYGEIAGELDGLRRYLAGRELAALVARLAAAAARHQALTGQAADQVKTLAEIDASVVAQEVALASVGPRELVDDIARHEQLLERARGVSAVLAERRRALDQQAASVEDDSAVAVLEAELVAALRDTATAAAEVQALEPSRQEIDDAERALAEDRQALVGGEDARGGFPEGAPLDPARALAELRREQAGLRSGIEQAEGELRRLAARREQLSGRAARLMQEADQMGAAGSGADRAGDTLAEEVERGEAARGQAEERAATAEVEFREAEAEARAWNARADALGQALDGARAHAGAATLAGIDGVLGTLLDVISVDEGWEASLEAAAGDALAALVVADQATARRALAALRDAGLAGAILAPPQGQRRPASQDTPFGEAVRGHVRALDSGLDGLLELLVGGAVRLDGTFEEVVEAAIAHPETVIVTADGDRFGPSGWRLGAARAGATAALLDEARHRVTASAEVRDQMAAAQRSTSVGAAAARQAWQQAVRAADAHATRQREDIVRHDRLAQQQRELEQERAELDAQCASLEVALAERWLRRDTVLAALPALESAAADVADAIRLAAEARAGFDRQGNDLGRRRGELSVRSGLLEQRRLQGQARVADLQRRLVGHGEASRERRSARGRAARQLVVVAALAARVVVVVDALMAALQVLGVQRDERATQARERGRDLDELRQRRAAAERRLGELRELAGRAELDGAEARIRLETASENVRITLDTDPETLLAEHRPIPPDGVDPAARGRELERELRLLGPVNPLAVEEFAALTERHEFLESQLADVRESRRDLSKVIRAIDEEIASVFAGAFADVGGHFETLFETLFPGGQGALRLTQPDSLLTTGVEVEARPSGKNVRKLSLLSGGERSLTALGLLFAIFRSRPSPFYVMDEVEAALDDVNLARFLDLVDAFRADAQLIIVSHQKRTMELADCLYGVTMKPGDSSRVVSERLRSR